MPTKFNRWGKPQNYDPSTGRFGEGEGKNGKEKQIAIQLFAEKGKHIDNKNEREYNGNKDKDTLPKASGYNRPKTKHHIRHAEDMGLNEKDYIQAAIDFFNGRDGDMYYSQNRKKYYKYDHRKELICVCGEDGMISHLCLFQIKNLKGHSNEIC